MAVAVGEEGQEFGAQAVMVCRCEEVSQGEVLAAIGAGAVTVNDVKRWTRAGMGLCQGIYCMPAIAVLAAQASGRPIERVAPMTARTPLRPISLDVLAEMAGDENDDGMHTAREEG